MILYQQTTVDYDAISGSYSSSSKLTTLQNFIDMSIEEQQYLEKLQ